MEQITRGDVPGSRACRGRSGQARDPGACGRCSGRVVTRRALRRDASSSTGARSCRRAASWPWRSAPARTTGRGKLRGAGSGAAADVGPAGRALPQRGRERQERRQRRGGDLRGGLAPDDALRAGEVRRAAERCCACTGCAKVSRTTAPPASTASAACWPSSGSSSPRVPRHCSSTLADVLEDGANEMNTLARRLVDAARAGAVARARRRTSPGATSASSQHAQRQRRGAPSGAG